MTPCQLRDALAALRWSQRGLAEALGCDDRLVRRWASGDAVMPPDIALWLGHLSQFHRSNPPPETWRTRRLQR
jgi:transcriptional regulator with XRE-family HTH domain